MFLLPVALAGAVLYLVYRFVPPARPGQRAINLPALVTGLSLVAMTRLFAILAPWLFGMNFVYRTLGAIFVGLAWLGLACTCILLGASWVRERTLSEMETAAVA